MNDAVETAKSPGVFDLNKFLSDTSYPVQDVTVHGDGYAVNEKLKVMERIIELQEQIKSAETIAKAKQRTLGEEVPVDPKLTEALAELEVKITEWDAVIDASAITFTLQGMPPEIVEQISAKYFIDPKRDYTNSEEENNRDYEIMARTVIKITDFQGNVSTSVYAPEDMAALRKRLLEGEYNKLVQGVSRVTLNGALFEIAADASFLSRRTNVAG